ncbi:MAG TPA: hypothetical protein VE646_12155 [Actinomycetota bacterium]|nr:hypothetical protein [Actinomycetota bacterium]
MSLAERLRREGHPESLRLLTRQTTAVSVAIWVGILGAVLLLGWTVVLGDAMFELGCSPGSSAGGTLVFGLITWAHILSASAAFLTLCCLVASLWAFFRLRRMEEDLRVERARVLSIAAIGISAFALLMAVYSLLPPFLMSACSTSP